VLKRLEELGVLPMVEALSTVSGGSITGALYALRCAQAGGPPGSSRVDALIDEMVPFLTSNLRAEALYGSPARVLRALRSVVSTRVSRIGLMIGELDRRLYGGATLDQLPDWIVVNATNLRTGKAWKFYRDRAGDYLAGATDQTSHLKVAGAVAASAAYPGLTDSFAFVTRWEDLHLGLLSEDRWERPTGGDGRPSSRWRDRFGAERGPAVFPLVDGGLYDNEGVNGLRGRGVTHAIISGAAPPESEFASGFTPKRYLRIVEVIHDRLGAATRQLAYEMTHGVHPNEARETALALARDLRRLGQQETTDVAVRAELDALADRAASLAAVGVPRRGPQFRASAQVLLHQTGLARNAYARPGGAGLDGLDVLPEFRGLDAALVEELSRVRTDLDALEPQAVELLMAQGYFLTDAHVKLTMPDLLSPEVLAGGGYGDEGQPRWARAHAAVAAARADAVGTASVLRMASARRMPLGRVQDGRARRRYVASILVTSLGVLTVLVILVWLLVGAIARVL
jgi:predicted acylesterase/phospholipase RssA